MDLGGQAVTATIPAGPGAPTLEPGDKVIVIVTADPENPASLSYSVIDRQRGVPLALLLVVFAAAVIAFGRWRGLAALGGLAVTFTVLLIFLVPAILAGEDPLLVALVAAGGDHVRGALPDPRGQRARPPWPSSVRSPPSS